MKTTFFLSLLLTSCSGLPSETSVIPEKLAELPAYCEGIVFDQQGNGFASVTRTGEIFTFGPEFKPVVWARVPAPNGHKILPDGTHLVCAGRFVLKLDRNGSILDTAAAVCGTDSLRAPNDLTLDSANGGFYFTDPGGSSETNPIGTVHYTDSTGKTILAAQGLAFPNGVVLLPGGKELIVGEANRNRILKFEISAPGSLTSQTVLAYLPAKSGDQIGNYPDGICLDDTGRLFIAHWGMRTVQVLDPAGNLLRSYPAGNLTTSNVAFTGPGRDELIVTGALLGEGDSPGGLWRLKLPGVKGK